MARTKKTMKKRAKRKPRVPRNLLKRSIYLFSRKWEKQYTIQWTSDNYGGTGANQQQTFDPAPQLFRFKLSDLPGYTDFTNLFQMYRINKITLKFHPLWFTESVINADPLTSAIRFGVPILTTTPVYNKNAAASNLNELLEYQGTKRASYNKTIVRTLFPKLLQQVTPDNGATYYKVIQSGAEWLNSDGASGVEYNGLGVGLDGRVTVSTGYTSTTYNFDWLASVQYDIECKDPR